MLNKSKGNMYPWVNATWNVIKGKCPHDCSYCYMKRYPQKELHFDEKELNTNLGSGNTIFVGSSCDMWARGVSNKWIERVVIHCSYFPYNHYLFQTKNPGRFIKFADVLPVSTMLGCTIESNRYSTFSDAPPALIRKEAMQELVYPKMISIEPIMDFDLDDMVRWIQESNPEFVSIGADSGNNHLPEPSADKVKALIEGIRDFTGVKVKDNLKRLLNA